MLGLFAVLASVGGTSTAAAQSFLDRAAGIMQGAADTMQDVARSKDAGAHDQLVNRAYNSISRMRSAVGAAVTSSGRNAASFKPPTDVPKPKSAKPSSLLETLMEDVNNSAPGTQPPNLLEGTGTSATATAPVAQSVSMPVASAPVAQPYYASQNQFARRQIVLDPIGAPAVKQRRSIQGFLNKVEHVIKNTATLNDFNKAGQVQYYGGANGNQGATLANRVRGTAGGTDYNPFACRSISNLGEVAGQLPNLLGGGLSAAAILNCLKKKAPMAIANTVVRNSKQLRHSNTMAGHFVDEVFDRLEGSRYNTTGLTFEQMISMSGELLVGNGLQKRLQREVIRNSSNAIQGRDLEAGIGTKILTEAWAAASPHLSGLVNPKYLYKAAMGN